MRGTISKSRDGVLLWDMQQPTNGLVLALPVGRHEPIDPERYVYIDGRPLHSDNQLLNASGKGKSCVLMPLRLKHDFLRWYAKHIDNHLPDSPPHRRCQQKSLQFVVVDPGSANPRLFIRPIFKFYEQEIVVEDTHEYFKRPKCRYLIGIDVGINYVFRAVVLDTEEKAVVADIGIAGRKEEWRELREQLGYHQQRRAYLRAQNAKPAAIERETKAIRALRKKDRGLGHTEAVEAVARLVERLETSADVYTAMYLGTDFAQTEEFKKLAATPDVGRGNYCIVMEDLEFGSMNLKRNNRVKHLASVRDAVRNQLRKRGYKYREKSEKVDGLRFEAAHYTSQVSPFGWWAKKEECERVWKEEGRPIGRRIGNWYEKRSDGKPCRRGRYERVQGRGRPAFIVEEADRQPGAKRRANWGSELFWDPYCKSVNGVDFPNGVVLDADFVGAFNLAVRPLVKETSKKLPEIVAEHQALNPTFRISCQLSAFDPIERNGAIALHPLLVYN
jgi:hypothetical protein